MGGQVSDRCISYEFYRLMLCDRSRACSPSVDTEDVGSLAKYGCLSASPSAILSSQSYSSMRSTRSNSWRWSLVSDVMYRYIYKRTVVECRSLAGELSLSCARPAADGWPLMWVRPSAIGQPTRPTQPSFHPFGVDKMSSKLESDVCCRLQVAPSGESYEGKRRPDRKQWQPTSA